MSNTFIPSADKLIGEIREMYDNSRGRTADTSCKLIDGKLAARESAERRAFANAWNAQPTRKTSHTRNSTDERIIEKDGNVQIFKETTHKTKVATGRSLGKQRNGESATETAQTRNSSNEVSNRKLVGKKGNPQSITKTSHTRNLSFEQLFSNAEGEKMEDPMGNWEIGFELIAQLAKDEDQSSRYSTKHSGVRSCCANTTSHLGRRCHSTGARAESCQRTLPKVFDAVGKQLSHVMGEIILQLEKRIIFHVFPNADRTYYGTLADIRQVIAAEPSKERRETCTQALDCRIHRLLPLGWNIDYHVDFGNRIKEKYGVGAPAFFYEKHDPLATHAQLARLIVKKLPLAERIGMMTILSGLLSLALDDGRPLFLNRRGEEFEMMYGN